MACSDRQEVASCVSQLDKANLLLKWPRSMLPLFFIDYDILRPFVIFFNFIVLYYSNKHDTILQHLNEVVSNATILFPIFCFKSIWRKFRKTLDFGILLCKI
jgi:hypothetical protein